MKCYYYCHGRCRWHGDSQELCKRIERITHRKIKGGYCPKEEHNRDLERLADSSVAAMEDGRL